MRKNNKNRVHAPEFKIQVVESILRGEASITGSSKKYNIAKEVIRKWVLHYQEDGVEYFLEEHRGRTRKNNNQNVDLDSMTLEEQNHYLRMENAILKKAKALALIK